MQQVKTYLLPFILSIWLFGCMTVPVTKEPKPWVRSLNSAVTVNPTAKIKIQVSGTSTPLLGSEQLISDRILDKLTYLLKRRGFTFNNETPEYVVQLLYKTERRDKMQFYSSISTSSLQAFSSITTAGMGVRSGLGVIFAQAINEMFSSATTTAEQAAEQKLSYAHTISIELHDKDGLIIWKGESAWDTDELDLVAQIVPAIQLTISSLPTDPKTLPEIQELKSSHVLNYYILWCRDIWFTCPALPNRIQFRDPASYSYDKPRLPGGVKNPNALAAYVDLIQTAEYALPSGDEEDWKDPIQASLWKEVTLGGQYTLGSSMKPTNILITIVGRSDGYYIDECKVATDQEYSQFTSKLSKWQQMLQDYYDVYVD